MTAASGKTNGPISNAYIISAHTRQAMAANMEITPTFEAGNGGVFDGIAL